MKTSKLWDNEYEEIKGIPTSDKIKNGSHARYFLNHLKSNNIFNGNFLDIGCGLGVDSLFFAENGFYVVGVDISTVAINKAKANHRKNLEFRVQDIRKEWKFKDDEFIAAYDGTTLINLITDEQVEHYFLELSRVLLRDGRYQIVSPVLPDEYYAKLVGVNNSKIVSSEAGFVQRVYDKEEIKKIIERHFSIEKVDIISKQNSMYGSLYNRTLMRIVAKNDKK